MRAGRGAVSEVSGTAEGSGEWQQGGEEAGPLQQEAALLLFLFQTRSAAEEAQTATVTTCKRRPEQVLTKTWSKDR